MNWIHINTKRPPIGSDVYVIYAGSEKPVARFGTVEMAGDQLQAYDGFARFSYRDFTHWMPRESIPMPETGNDQHNTGEQHGNTEKLNEQHP